MPTIESLEARVHRLDAELAAVRRDLQAVRQQSPELQQGTTQPATEAPPARLRFSAPQRGKVQPAGEAPAARLQFPAPQGQKAQPGIGWEDLLAGRVMAWVGGSAVLIGLVLLLAMAVSRGWIGEEARTLMAAAASLLLVVGGARAYERRGRTEAALAATGAGIAGGFGTLAVATEVYGLLPAEVGLPLGLALGAVAAALAMRWRSRTVAILGIAGGLLSPVLAGADLNALATIGLLAAGFAGAAAVCVVLRWPWLGLLAFGLALPQWIYHAVDERSLAVVILFGVIGAVAAAGFELRVRAGEFPLASHTLLALNSLVVTLAGVAVLERPEAWLVALAAVHLLGAAAAPRSLRVAVLGLGVVLADIALADLVDGVALPVVWAASAVLFVLLARHHRAALAGVGGHVALAIGHVLTQEAPLGDLGGGGSTAGLAATAAIAAACLVSSRVADTRLRTALELIGLAAVAYATALALGGAALSVAWAAEAAALAGLRAKSPALAFFAGALLCALGTVAPLHALDGGVADLPAATFALIAIAGAALALRSPAATGVVLLHLVSLATVTLVDGQAGQFALSALWCLTGLAALAAGVIRDVATLRAGALALLALAAAKVFVVDLAALDALARVGSFLTLGTLLLLGAFAWQRREIESRP